MKKAMLIDNISKESKKVEPFDLLIGSSLKFLSKAYLYCLINQYLHKDNLQIENVT
ncbi:hypothetical protein GCM10023211_06820 [Orbus sasakiae]|uniref:Uncharacterized protein n=1 Tax=Orbus sasakiae TaxID=1078475 RepID=A0ABP9N138_9GAMM